MKCEPGCIKRPTDAHDGRCRTTPAALSGPANPHVANARRQRDKRLKTPLTPPPSPSTITLPDAVRDAVLQVAAADLAYQRALENTTPREARRVLYDQCIPARQAYRRALDEAAKEDAC